MKKIVIACMFCLIFDSFAYAKSRSDVRLGIGGMQGTHKNDSAGRELSATGGYLTLIGRDFYQDGKFYGEGGGDIGFAKSKEKGSSSGRLYYFGETHLKYGVNLTANTAPLYLNIGYSWDQIATDFNDTPKGQSAMGLRTNLHLVGVDLQGFMYRSERLAFEYNVGYWYPFYAAYYGNGVFSRVKDYSQVFKAQVGFTYALSENVSYFMNLKAKYYDIARTSAGYSFTYPKAQNLIAMLELGLQF